MLWLVHACGGSDFELTRNMAMSRPYVLGSDGSLSSDADWSRTPLGYDTAVVRCLTCGLELPTGSDLLAEVIKRAYAAIAADSNLA